MLQRNCFPPCKTCLVFSSALVQKETVNLHRACKGYMCAVFENKAERDLCYQLGVQTGTCPKNGSLHLTE